MLERLELTISDDFRALSEAGDSVATFLEGEDVDAADVFSTGLVLEELVTNVILYAFEDGAGHEISIEVAVDDTELRLRISDEGRAFDPTRVPEPELAGSIEEAPIGGRGLALVRRRVRDFRYERVGDRNRLEVRLARRK
jgi:anti-sigma regulatory factor (Ser/Thr protein kinase)